MSVLNVRVTLVKQKHSFMCADPEMPLTIIGHVPDHRLTILLQAVVQMFECAPVAVHEGQAGAGTDPESSGRIGNQSSNAIGNERIVRTRVCRIATICLRFTSNRMRPPPTCSIPEVTTVIHAHRVHGFITMTGGVGILPGIDRASAGLPVHGGNE